VQLNTRINDLNLEVDKEFETGIKYAEKLNARRLQVMNLEAELLELKDLNDVLYNIIQANSRTRKAYDKYLTSKPIAGADESAPLGKIIHDSLGNATLHLADPSESVNNRHIEDLSNEVIRGVKEQSEAIKKELASVDMSTLQVGDTVKFRNNTFDQIDRVQKCNDDWDYKLNFADGTVGAYMKDGSYRKSETPNMNQWDIIQIIKPAKSEVKFEPQVDEAVHIKASRGNFKVKEVSVQGNGYLLASESNGIAHFRFISELAPIKGYRYENGFMSNDICHKTNKPCEFGCYGLCKDA